MDNVVFIEHRSNVLNLMHLRSVSVLVPGVSSLVSSTGWGHSVVFLGKTLIAHSASLHPGV